MPLADQILPDDVNRVIISNNVLTIKTLNAERDDGMYQCAASNTHGTRYSSGQLKVLGMFLVIRIRFSKKNVAHDTLKHIVTGVRYRITNFVQ